MLNAALGEWAWFNGWCLSEVGCPARELEFADLCDLIYYWLVKDCDTKDRTRLDFDLSIPPANTVPEADDPMWSEEAEMAAFMNARG